MEYYLKKFWVSFFIMIILFSSNSILGLLPLVLRIQQLDALVQKNINQFFCLLALSTSVTIIAYLLRYAGQLFSYSTEKKISNCMRNDISCKLINQSYQKFHKKQIGDYIAQYTNDIEQAHEQGFRNLTDFVCTIVETLGALVILYMFHWSLAVYSICASILLLIIPRVFDKRANQKAKDFSMAQEVFLSHLKDFLSGYDIFKSFQVKERFIGSIRHASEKRENSLKDFFSFRASYSIFILVLNFIFLSLGIALIGILSYHSLIPITTLTGGMGIISTVFDGAALTFQYRLRLIGSKPFFEKITPKEEQLEIVDRPKLSAINNGIFMNNISYAYGEKQVLNQLSFSFEKGKKYALVGTSGSGKTTIFKIILNQLTDYHGKILIDGIDAKQLNEDDIYQQLAYIEQDVYLFNDSIYENITLGHSFSDEQIEAALRDSALSEDIKKIQNGLNFIVGEDGRNLSGGQKQRIAIARALIHNKSYLLVDEGTSALDKENAKLVEDHLLNNPNITVILITHHLDEQNYNLFDQIYNLDKLQTA